MRKSNIFLFGMVMGAWLNMFASAAAFGALHIWWAPFALPYCILMPLLFANIIWKGK